MVASGDTVLTGDIQQIIDRAIHFAREKMENRKGVLESFKLKIVLDDGSEVNDEEEFDGLIKFIGSSPTFASNVNANSLFLQIVLPNPANWIQDDMKVYFHLSWIEKGNNRYTLVAQKQIVHTSLFEMDKNVDEFTDFIDDCDAFLQQESERDDILFGPILLKIQKFYIEAYDKFKSSSCFLFQFGRSMYGWNPAKNYLMTDLISDAKNISCFSKVSFVPDIPLPPGHGYLYYSYFGILYEL